MAHTDDGIPLLGVGGGDPALLRLRIEEARGIADPAERAARLYFLGRGLFDCDAPGLVPEAIAVLGEAMRLGSSHAALDLGTILLSQAETPSELAGALVLVERAAAEGLPEAEQLLARIDLGGRAGRE